MITSFSAEASLARTTTTPTTTTASPQAKLVVTRTISMRGEGGEKVLAGRLMRL